MLTMRHTQVKNKMKVTTELSMVYVGAHMSHICFILIV